MEAIMLYKDVHIRDLTTEQQRKAYNHVCPFCGKIKSLKNLERGVSRYYR